ncbi:venom peptide CtAPI-like [Battus philenor]|uniref:venom peptide CtAPI-like n=1 Tax=Battus philenor TaxID=42288 RepID=UPI0035CF442F
MTSYALASILFIVVVAVIGTPINERKPLNCPANEMYHECAPAVCYKNCAHLKKPDACASVSADCYVPMCLCKQDYLRNEKGICVPIAEC